MPRAQQDGVTNLALPVLQQTLLADALDCGPALIFVADEKMRYLAVNQTACDVLGYTREELLSLRVTDIAVADDAPDLYRAMLGARLQAGTTAIRAKDGRVLSLLYRASEVKVAGMPYYVAVGFVPAAD